MKFKEPNSSRPRPSSLPSPPPLLTPQAPLHPSSQFPSLKFNIIWINRGLKTRKNSFPRHPGGTVNTRVVFLFKVAYFDNSPT